MKTETLRAQKLLKEQNFTCVFCCGDETITSTERGVKPLLDMLAAGKDLKGFCAADKIVGRAAGFLYILLGAEEIYAEVMSTGAKDLLEKSGIRCECSVLTEIIRNRENTGLCPMETAVLEIEEPEKALEAIKQKAIELRKNAI